ncbi:MAG: 6-phospho-3-hexuloisomerase [Hadesarchaea archaeon]|nr:6-phospho-3-hexuloisomerase [Hadesarchaea archaeon]
MRETQRALSEILEHLQVSSKKLRSEQVDGFIDALLGAKRVFVVGAGRSGLVVRAFAMRLMHLGIDVHVIGETITPALRDDDFLVALSGSGKTSFAVSAAKIAKRIGTKIAVITSYPRSTLAKLADHIITLPGRTKIAAMESYLDRQIVGEYESLAPMGTLFEVTALVFLDSVVASLIVKLGRKEEELRARHATI